VSKYRRQNFYIISRYSSYSHRDDVKIAQEDYHLFTKIDAAQNRLAAQYMIWISGGMIAAEMTTINSLISFANSQWPILIFVSLLCFILSILLSQLSFVTSSKALKNRLDSLDARRYGESVDSKSPKREKIFGIMTHILNCLLFFSFYAGFLLLIVFVGKNYQLFLIAKNLSK
jgi:hypothetical protein